MAEGTALGNRLRALRKERGWTLTDLAQHAKIGIATLSRVETGKMRGTIDCHRQIAGAFGLTLTELYREVEEAHPAVVVKRRGEKSDTFLHGANVTSEFLTTDILRKKMMPLLVHVAPGGKTPLEETHGGVEKFLYVLDGAVDLTIKEDSHVLKTGDCVYFDASLPHVLKSHSTRPSRCLCLLSPPHL